MNAQITTQDESKLMEEVLLGGDLSKLSPSQRVVYYKKVCESLGLNPLTKPFNYITLRKGLTLYATKDAADQLRSLHDVSIDDVATDETETHFIVKVKGHDKSGRSDVEVGVVSKKDMQGDFGNAYMKAVTKAKRRFTLSICGLGMLDETEISSIPDAAPVVVQEDGEIENPDPIDDKTWQRYLETRDEATALGLKFPGLPPRSTTLKADLIEDGKEIRRQINEIKAQDAHEKG